MLYPDNYPLSEDALTPAYLAATEVCSGGDPVNQAVRTIVAASAPHSGAAALLDLADDLCPVGEDSDVSRPMTRSEVAWMLRKRAGDLVNYDQVQHASETA